MKANGKEDTVMTIALSVVVPVHNEIDNLRPLIEEIEGAVKGLGAYEILYIDDGSTDDTFEILRGLQREFRLCSEKHKVPRLRVQILSRADLGRTQMVQRRIRFGWMFQ